VTNVEALPRAMNASLAESRFRTLLLAIFGAIALVLATVGIYDEATRIGQRLRGGLFE
jgi:hypothetical protein